MTYEAWRISYQSSEQAARAAYAECVRLSARLEAAEKERDDLRAKIEEMEKQEPVAWIVAPSSRPFWGKYARQDAESEARRCGGTAKAEPIYLSPGAQPAPSIPEGWKLVPIEPTHETLMDIVGAVTAPLSFREVRAIYDTLLDAKGE